MKDEPKYKVQYETALTYQQNSKKKDAQEAEKLRLMAHQRLCEYAGLMERAILLMKEGRTYQALELMRGGLQWAGAVLSDLERASAAERRDLNPFLVQLKKN